MAYPIGLTRAKLKELKATPGAYDAWIAEHKAHSEAGTVKTWLEGQGLYAPPVAAAKAVTPKAAPVKRRSILAMIGEYATNLADALANLSTADFGADDREELEEVIGALAKAEQQADKAAKMLKPVMERIWREADLLADLAAKENELEALRARVAEMEISLKATGHSDKVPAAKKGKTLVAVE